MGFFSFDEEQDLLYPYSFDQQEYEGTNSFIVASISDQDDHLISATNGLSDLIIAPMLIMFPYDFEANEDRFLPNQTVCMSISTDALFKEFTIIDRSTDVRFEDTGCLTIYLIDRNLIQCACESVERRVYRLVIDYSRVVSDRFVVEGKGDFDFYYLPMIIFFAIFGFAGPFIVVKLDQLDYRSIEDDLYDVDDDLKDQYV